MPAQYPDGVRRIDNPPLVESTEAFYRMVARLIEEKRIFVSKTDRESYSVIHIVWTEKEAAASFSFDATNSFRVTTPPVEISLGRGGSLFKGSSPHLHPYRNRSAMMPHP
ncbi:MAG: hypothetical protein ACLSTO_01535 [Bilophila wadsworthia]